MVYDELFSGLFWDTNMLTEEDSADGLLEGVVFVAALRALWAIIRELRRFIAAAAEED